MLKNFWNWLNPPDPKSLDELRYERRLKESKARQSEPYDIFIHGFPHNYIPESNAQCQLGLP